ncbi:MAG TPA: RICIN domain-containing protein [Polyangia bacterium]|nr:RICIN domain-containing protein [Polyangia bacterium]
MRRAALAATAGALAVLLGCAVPASERARLPDGAVAAAGGGGAGPAAGGGQPSGGGQAGGGGRTDGGATGGGRGGATLADASADASAGDRGAPLGPTPPTGRTLLLIGQSGRRPHAEYVATTGSVPAGGSVYAELYTGQLLNWEHEALVAYLARDYPGSYVEVGLSWKDDRVGAGYCDLSAGCAQNCCAPGDDQAPVLPELDIVAGRYDAAIDAFAAALAARPTLRFLVRLDYEVSPDLFCTRAGDCAPYTAAFDYLAARIRAGDGAGNVQFVFHPTRGWAQRMYPGPANTDWIGFSIFNHDVCLPASDGTMVTVNCPPSQALDANLAGDLAWAHATGKPVLVAESAVQNTADDAPATFADYLGRLYAVIEADASMRGLTYINMKWTGDWVYGENWTLGAFADTDSRVERDPADQSAWCGHLAGGRYLGLAGRPATCGAPPASAPPLPPDLDAPVYTVVALATNQCLRIPGTAIDDAGPIVGGACTTDGRARFRLVTGAGGAVQIFNDATWLCLEADAGGAGTPLVQRPCADVAAQRFVQGASSDGVATDVTFQPAGSAGLCLGLATATGGGAPGVVLQPCGTTSGQIFRLQLQPF